MPPKYCYHFQRTGNCRYGDSCRYAHSNDSEIPSYSRDIAHSRAYANVPIDSKPFSLEALQAQLANKIMASALFSGNTDALVVFWPGQDHLEFLWKGFLMPSDLSNAWQIDSQTQVLNFINAGLHALTKDNLAPQFVRELGKTEGRGVVVIKELLYHTYDVDAGRQRNVVSFQRGFVPFLTMLTMRRIEMVSQHMDEANYVYAYLRTVHVQLFQLYLKHLHEIVERHSIDDCRMSHATFLQETEGRKYAPLCFTQVCLPFIRLLYVLGNKFKEFIYEASFHTTVNDVDAMTSRWIDELQDSDSSLDSNLCFQVMNEEIKRLHQMIRRAERGLRAGTTRSKERLKRDWDEAQPWDYLEVGMPGNVVRVDGTIGPRHDNDCHAIQDIRLLPTTDECLSRESPLLPGNFLFHANAHWLPPGPERWVDTHFRLYREDLCGTIRSCLLDLHHRLSESNEKLATGRLRDADVDYNVYPILGSAMPLKHSRGEQDRSRKAERHGLCIDVWFEQPSAVEMTGQKMKTQVKSRHELWEKTNRLPFNGMVALVACSNGTLEVVFCRIIERELEKLVEDIVEVTLQPFEVQDLALFERWQISSSGRPQDQKLLLEFNKVFYVAYEPVLRALQTLKPSTLPFLDYLAPETAPRQGATYMECPLYCSSTDFTFDLSSVLRTCPNHQVTNRPQTLRLDPLELTSRSECEAALVRYSTLERDQAKALVEALSSRVACIQGLPGSGKSFIGSMLTHIIVEANVSPVLVVCYTNHALDQFLCHLLDIGLTRLVRVGGQCKEPRLEKYNLSHIPRYYQRYELKRLYETLDNDANAIAFALRELESETRRPTWKGLKWVLEANYPDVYDSFVARDSELHQDDFFGAGYDDILEYWMQGKDLGPFRRQGRVIEGRRDSNVWAWSLPARCDALAVWVGKLRSGRVELLINTQKAYLNTLRKIQTVRHQADVSVLQHVQIIGMTTTGVAKNQEKIAAVRPPVVICEEAGEVLEAQLVTCLSPFCQHLVLIGDHQQLRPHIADHNLSVESGHGKRYALDVSLFERLVAPASGLPFWMLTEQHRMRPQISQLIRMLFYPKLRDARETLKYPHLLGVVKDVFFVNHNNPEDGASGVLGASSRSHSNEYEVAYVVAALKYLLKQGYHTSDIAILTPYVGQLIKLRSALRGEYIVELDERDVEEMERTFDEEEHNIDEEVQEVHGFSLEASKKELAGTIRAATIDNFQGEEATIIVASLVRSTTDVRSRRTIGFLKIPNRINVLLSRAKHGLILVGQGELLRAKSPLWQQILDQLQSDGCYGDGLPLYCQQHPNYQRVATTPESFALLAPDGGCLRPCGTRLPLCGHACPTLCHVDQPSHRSVYCTQPCPRLQEGCGHVCPDPCGDACGRCKVLVGTIDLPCGHTYNNARCFEAKMPSKVLCKVYVEKLSPPCGHWQRIACSTTKIECSQKCGRILSCGHACTRRCSECIQKTLNADEESIDMAVSKHGACQKKCERMLPCCHSCQGVCHSTSSCPPCQRLCDVFSCEHGSCNHPCSDPCAACTEQCNWTCKHCGDCPLPCGAPCNRRLCDQRCAKELSCGHQCRSVCGEVCPSRKFCHVCSDTGIKQRVADVILFQPYEEIDPNEDPIFVLQCCSMVYTMATLDGTLHMSTYFDSNGLPHGPRPGGYLEVPQCPNCKKPIRGLRRYGRVIKRAAIDAAEKNFISHSYRVFKALQERTHAVVETGDLTNDKALWQDVRLYGANVKRPPCQNVFEACVALLTKAKGGQGGGDVIIDQSVLPVPDSKFKFLGSFNLLSAQLSNLRTGTAKANAAQCARQAINEFEKGSFEMQTGEARLLLVQILIANAEAELIESVTTEKARKKREETVERLAKAAHDEVKR